MCSIDSRTKAPVQNEGADVLMLRNKAQAIALRFSKNEAFQQLSLTEQPVDSIILFSNNDI